MQKVLFITTILLTLFALSIRAEHNPRKRPDVSAQFQTVSGHSISLNGIGLAYSYEYAFAPKGTIIFSAGSSYAFGRILQLKMESLREFHIDTKDYHLVTGDLAIEPRFYYNLKKRHRNGKRTWGNSGGYLSVNFGYSFSNNHYQWSESSPHICYHPLLGIPSRMEAFSIRSIGWSRLYRILKWNFCRLSGFKNRFRIQILILLF